MDHTCYHERRSWWRVTVIAPGRLQRRGLRSPRYGLRPAQDRLRPAQDAAAFRRRIRPDDRTDQRQPPRSTNTCYSGHNGARHYVAHLVRSVSP